MLRPEISPDLVPSRLYPPLLVVILQLDALQNNDLLPQNSGIQVAWNFASPGNRALVGPYAEFVQLMKSPLYKCLVGYEWAEMGGAVERDDRVQQSVRLHHHRRGSSIFVFLLSLQDDSRYEGCWMTDAIIPIG